MALLYEKAEVISLKGHPEWDESFVQQRIAEDPSILGLRDDLLLRDKERIQPTRGRLDLLLQTVDRQSWFEVEVQLGPTDESHIIRTIEYWDIERKRYPEISHTAVIIAEEITSRFFNVIALFNQSIPIIAIKLSAIQFGDKASLLFTRVLDYTPRGIEEEDEEPILAVDRSTWERRSNPVIISYIDTLLSGVREIDPTVAPKYNQSYVGTQIGGRANNFVYFHPQSRALRIHLRLSTSKELGDELDSRNIGWETENSRTPRYKIRLLQTNFAAQAEFMKDLIMRSYKEFELSPAVA